MFNVYYILFDVWIDILYIELEVSILVSIDILFWKKNYIWSKYLLLLIDFLFFFVDYLIFINFKRY